MKKLLYILFLSIVVSLNYSCEKDNYDEPTATIQGQIYDHNGKPLQLEQGKGSMTIKMEELSWKTGDEEVSVAPMYLNMKQNGSYINTKWFAGEYKMTPTEGAFYPYNEEGEVVNIKGTTTKDFTVVPYLDVEWVKEPYVTSNNFIEASVKFKRNTLDGATMPDLNNALFCIAMTEYVGNNNYDSQLIGGTVKITNDMENTTIEFRTTRAVKYTNMSYYVRVGICCSDAYKRYNYTDIKVVEVP